MRSAAMADGRLAMWLPTSTTLQQLEQATSIEEIRDRLAPAPLGAVEVERLSPGVTRIVMPAGGGVAGQPVCAYLVGDRRFVLIDPGDPTGPAIERAIEIAKAAGGSIEAVALTHVDPDHAAGAEAVALRLGIPVLAGPDVAGRCPTRSGRWATGSCWASATSRSGPSTLQDPVRTTSRSSWVTADRSSPAI